VVDDVVRGLGRGFIKLVSAGRYESADNGLLLEGGTGLFLLGGLFYLLQKFVL
jgi:hypothetical protein